MNQGSQVESHVSKKSQQSRII